MRTTKSQPLVVHIIYALKAGGLENGLVNIINRSPVSRYRHAIICLTEADSFADRITVDNIEVIQLYKEPGHDLKFYWRVWSVLRKLKPEIVHTRNLAALELQPLAFLSGHAKRVHGEHGRDMRDLEGNNRKFNLFRQLMRPFVHQYIAVSQDLGQWLTRVIKVKKSRLQQIYNGVDQDKFTRKLIEERELFPEDFSAENSVIIGSVGRLSEVKNQRSLIKAMGILMTKEPGLKETLRLMIVGDGPMWGQLEKEVRLQGLENQVWLTGDRNDIPQLLQCMDVFVLPSLGEGISNTILEAMATKLPVIATDVGGNSELIEHEINGLLVPADNDAALAESMLELIEDTEKRKLMGEHGLQKVQEKFNWDRAVNEYLAVYDELLGSS